MLENNEKYIKALKSVIDDGFDYGKLDNKSILVTGAAGLVGKALVDYMLLIGEEKGYGINVYAASRSEESFKQRFEARDNLKFYKYDIEENISKDLKFDYIIHAASNADPKMFFSDPVGTMTANFTGIKNILDYAKETGCERVLFVSSGEVYGQWDGACDAFDESYAGYVDFTNPRSCYPMSKRAAENLIVCYKEQFKTDSVIVRLSHTFGPTQLKRDSRAMSEFFNSAVAKKDIVLKSLGLPVRSYTCVFDAVSGILCALLRGVSGEAYNIANKNSIASIADLAKKIAKCADREVVFDIPEGGVKGASNIVRGVLDGKKLEGIGWKCVYDIDSGVKQTFEIMEEEYERDE